LSSNYFHVDSEDFVAVGKADNAVSELISTKLSGAGEVSPVT